MIFKKERGEAIYYAAGKLKLKYDTRFQIGKFNYTILNKDGKELDRGELEIQAGVNRYELELHKVFNIKNLEEYQLVLRDNGGKQYVVNFKYIDPELLKEGEYEDE